MSYLNQVIAIEKGTKSRVYGDLTRLNKAIQHPELFNGFSRRYRKLNDADETLPDESKRVQYKAEEILSQTERLMTEYIDITARKDWANCLAKGNVVVDGKTVLKDVPVSHLLFLEKQLTDVHTLIGNIPVLDESEDWVYDNNSALSKSRMTSTHRTKKVQKPIVLYDATPEHPAQAQLVTEDVTVGFWEQVKLSGAMALPAKNALTAKVEALLKAVKEAREAANMLTVGEVPSVGDAIFTFLFSTEEPTKVVNGVDVS